MNVKELMKRFLEEEGFKYEWDDECTTFKFQGLHINAMFFDNMDNLLSLAITFGTDSLPRYVLLDLCNELNIKSVLKHYLIDDTIIILCEEFQTSMEVSNEAVMDNLELLVQGAIQCRDRMNELSTYLSQSDKTVN